MKNYSANVKEEDREHNKSDEDRGAIKQQGKNLKTRKRVTVQIIVMKIPSFSTI